MTSSFVFIDPESVNLYLARSLQLETYMEMKCAALVAEAISIFQSRSRGSTKDSPTTPPHYISSFRFGRVSGLNWRVTNVDPGAMWVEFGARAGGKTAILRYRPLGTALDRVAGR